MSETEKFFDELGIEEKKDSVLEQPLLETPAEPEKEEDGLKAKNRRERRLLEQNQRLREEAIAASARLQGITEAQKLRETTEEAEFEKIAMGLYGNKTPEAAEASEIFKKALRGVYELSKREAKEEVLQEVDSRQSSESEAVKEEERNLDSMSDKWEDDYDIDMDDDDTRKAMFTLTEKLSPKDRDGNIIEYADPDAVAEVFLTTRERSSGRAKELASRSMTRSGSSQPSKLEDDATIRFLKENDII